MAHLGVTNVDDTVNFRWGRKIGDRLTDEGNQIYGSFTYKDADYNLYYCVCTAKGRQKHSFASLFKCIKLCYLKSE